MCTYVPRIYVAAAKKNEQGRNPLQVAGDGNASEGNPDTESRYKVRKEFFQHDPRNRTLVLHHPGTIDSRCPPPDQACLSWGARGLSAGYKSRAFLLPITNMYICFSSL